MSSLAVAVHVVKQSDMCVHLSWNRQTQTFVDHTTKVYTYYGVHTNIDLSLSLTRISAPKLCT